MAYYTGMRRGEILGLTKDRIDLGRRLIFFRPEHVKERDWKRVPIHKDLLPELSELVAATLDYTSPIFLHNGKPVVHGHQVRWCWDRKVVAKSGVNPSPRFHDLRHTWKTNARRSGMDLEIREAILGHATRTKSVSEGYGRISDEELIAAIDGMTFDHGPTDIPGAKKKNPADGAAG